MRSEPLCVSEAAETERWRRVGGVDRASGSEHWRTEGRVAAVREGEEEFGSAQKEGERSSSQ